MNNINR